MLKLTFDRATRAITVIQGSIKASVRERVQVTLLDSGSNILIPDTDAIVLQGKPKGQTDGDCLLLEAVLQAAQRNPDLKVYECELNAYTSRILALLGLNDGDGTNDAKAPVLVDGYLLLFQNGFNEPIESDTFPISLVPSKYLNTDVAPAAVAGPVGWLMNNASRYLPAVTGLMGGGATKLDGLATVGITPPVLVELVIGDVPSKWLLKAGTDAVDNDGSLRPTDYNASTNAKFWKQIA
jgi:hypothetical protein